MRVHKADRVRFWSKVRRNGPIPKHAPHLGPCWLWMAGLFPKGYGSFWYDGRSVQAHRFAFLLMHGYWPVPCGMHLCDNMQCCNPSHIKAGTFADNIADMVNKGREHHPKGTLHGMHKLLAHEVRRVRSLYDTGDYVQSELAKMFRVTRENISAITRGKSWSHL